MGTVTLKHDVTNESVEDATLDGDIMDTYFDALGAASKGGLPQCLVGYWNCGKFCTIAYGLYLYDMAQVVPKDAVITAAEWWIMLDSYAPVTTAGQEAFKAERSKRNGLGASLPGSSRWTESGATLSRYAAPGGVDADVTGFATGGGNDYMDDSGASWTPDAFVGDTVRVFTTTFEERLIVGNTATRITVTPDWDVNPVGGAYGIDLWISQQGDPDTSIVDNLGVLPGDGSAADAAITTTTGPPGTFTDSRRSWTTNEWAGWTVSAGTKFGIIASNTGDTLTLTGGWSGGGNPGNGVLYAVWFNGDIWWSPSVINLVTDAHANHNGIVTFMAQAVSATAEVHWFQHSSKESFSATKRPHLRITYEMGVPTDSGANINEGGQFSPGDTTLTVTDGTKFAVGDFIRLENNVGDGYELLKITAISTNDLTVTRGEGSTDDVVHSDSIDIFLWDFATFQAVIYGSAPSAGPTIVTHTPRIFAYPPAVAGPPGTVEL